MLLLNVLLQSDQKPLHLSFLWILSVISCFVKQVEKKSKHLFHFVAFICSVYVNAYSSRVSLYVGTGVRACECVCVPTGKPCLAEKNESSGEPSVCLSDTKCFPVCGKTPKIIRRLHFQAERGQTHHLDSNFCFLFSALMQN